MQNLTKWGVNGILLPMVPVNYLFEHISPTLLKFTEPSRTSDSHIEKHHKLGYIYNVLANSHGYLKSFT